MVIITARYSWHVVDLENYKVIILIPKENSQISAKSEMIHG